ncbi:SpoIIE family protein phosphatase/ATP-binding protein [Kitasatospora sp. CMC57]|uniref:SpoIIE family protein phosphatase/ATP-binding protein n=1 Tax=Kitasatospora sp. CMC57 TaxID=3231513 RepID=A0AB33JLJ9_9ACTN
MARNTGRPRAPSEPESPGRRPHGGRQRTGPAARRGQNQRGGLRAALRSRSVAGQVFVLQVLIVLLLVVAAGTQMVLQARQDTATEARNRSLAVAETFAASPGMVEALRSPDPTAVLQPRAEAARIKSGVDFVVVLNTDAIRYTHPMPDRIGKKFVGTTAPALAGDSITEEVNGTIGHLVQAVVPITDSGGRVVGMVSAGIRTSRVSDSAAKHLPILLGSAAAALALALAGAALVSRRLRRQTHGLDPGEMTRMYEHHDAVLHAVREGVLIIGGDGRLLLTNDEASRLLALPPDAEGRHVGELGLDRPVAALLLSGQPASDEVVAAGSQLLAVNVRPTDRDGGPPGLVVTLRDSTELRALSGKADLARRRLKLLYDAGLAVGTTLDVSRTAQQLAEAAVPGFADYVTVDLAEAVLHGDEPEPGAPMRRAGLSGSNAGGPFYPVGTSVPVVPGTPRARSLANGQAEVEHDLNVTLDAWQEYDAERVRQVREQGVHGLLAVPLRARGVILGIAAFWRSGERNSFDEEDRSLAEELVARAAVSIDNARRYTREHTMAVTLQRSLLPGSLPGQNALDVAYRYLPAHAGVGGDWFDVIPLPGARVALVVGDVVGHGLHAAATMGRLRTAVHNFSSLDLPPDELLGHLDELVNRIDQEQATADGKAPITGATCLYAIYDPVSRRCSMARAGHLPPAVVQPDGTVEIVDLAAGPPLGLVTLPFETAELELPEGSSLVLYTDGLIEHRDRDIDLGLDRLRTSLSRADRSPEQVCDDVLDALLPANPTDDIALLVARTRALPAERVAVWDVPPDPAAVRDIRGKVTAKLGDWGLEDLEFTTELILSELITNAIRYGLPPIQVRLIHDRTLICEVSDRSSTSPHLRYAASTDEGGRGLFLVAQFAERWGTRYTGGGKVIWAEQRLP